MPKDNYKLTKEQIELIKMGIDEFIDYTNSHYGCYFKYYSNLEFYDKLIKEKYKGDSLKFYSDNNISVVGFTLGLVNYRLLKVANNIKNDIKNIHNNVIELFIQPTFDIYNECSNNVVRDWLYIFERFCYDKNYKLISLKEQNTRLANYPHFDASSKNPKTYSTQE